MKIKMLTKQSQQQVLAPSMQQSIEVLLLPLTELNTAIEQELQENPMLEIDEDANEGRGSILDEFISLNMKRLMDTPQQDFIYDSNNDDDSVDEKPIYRTAPLEDYLLQQLRLETTDPMELKIGELIIGNIDENGYFSSTCADVARHLELEDPLPVQMILHMIQNFEPLGIASRDLKECLLTQAHYRFNGEGALINKVINMHLEDIGTKKYQKIAKSLNISIEKVKEISLAISSLEPKPARKYRPAAGNLYIKPDITVSKDDSNNYRVKINKDSVPPLKINKFYQEMLKKQDLSEEELQFIREKIKNALLFIKSIEQRNQTIKDIANYIVEHQKDFFELGHLALKPLVFKNVAQAINRNESTVCRAVNNKYMDTPQGLLPMKFFFSQGIVDSTSNTPVASRGIKEEIKSIIDNENKTSPLSDQEIQIHFEQKGMQVARRTISKYRQAMSILPSHLRKV